jgi:AAA domain
VQNVIVYLMGSPGVGKYTVGKIVAERISAKLIDNHYWNNPIFEVIEPDGRPFPPGVWDRANDVRSAVLETVACFAPKSRSYVFTHAISAEGGHPIDFVIAGQILHLARRREAHLLGARLTCSEEQLRRRISAEGRRERFKATDSAKAGFLASMRPFPITHDWVLDINTTDLTPDQTADAIETELRRRVD